MAATATRPGAGRQTSGPKLRVPTDRQVNAQDTDRESAAYDAGRDGRDPPHPDEPQYVHDAYHLGRQDRGEQPSPSEPSPRALPDRSTGSKLSVADEGAPFLLGILAYCLGINYLRYGWPGVTGWLSAKFINKVTIGPNTATNAGPAVLVPNANPATGGQVPQAPVVMA